MEKIINTKALGVNVKKYRTDKRLSAEKLAELTGVSVSHIKNIESASTHPSAEVLVHIANALEISLDILLSDSLSGEAQKMARMMEYSKMLGDCSPSELKIITSVVDVLLKELREHKG